MRLASWNVESIRSHQDQVLAWVAANEADVLCMQETKAGPRKFPQRPWSDAGYEVVIHGGDDGRGGVAIASRLPLSDVDLGIPGSVAPLDEPRAIAATVGGVRVHTAYAPNGRKVGTHAHQVKLAWFTLYTAWLRGERDEFDELLVAADLNIAPRDIDVWDASRYRKRNLTSPEERRSFDRLLEEAHLVDIVRAEFADTPVFTWWNRRSDFYETNRGWRLDHLLASPSLAGSVTDIRIDRDERGRPGSTDHAPLIATFPKPDRNQ